jgi:dethiobiotin synthetase
MSMPGKNGYFIAGTDTGIGKTLIASALIHALVKQGRRVVGMKPVASGARWFGNSGHDGAWHNEDVEALRAASNVNLPDELINPYLLREATAPHIAAATEGKHINLDHIESCYRALCASADTVIVEGVGGFIVPLNEHCNTDDLVCRLGLPIILVVGIRLGCINHALLTTQAIAARGLHLAGWVANIVAPDMLNLHTNIDSLKKRISAPMLGCVPNFRYADTASATKFIDIGLLGY